jgi:hypothetical protein
MIPPMNGPNAGPIKVPERNHPMAVARSVGRYMSPIQLAPMVKKDVPSKAVKMRKMKYAARFGESPVPREQPRNSAAVTRHICFLSDFEVKWGREDEQCVDHRLD